MRLQPRARTLTALSVESGSDPTFVVTRARSPHWPGVAFGVAKTVDGIERLAADHALPRDEIVWLPGAREKVRALEHATTG